MKESSSEDYFLIFCSESSTNTDYYCLTCVGGLSAPAARTVVDVNVDVVRGKHVSQVTSCWAFSPEASVGLVCCVKWHYSTRVHMLLGWTYWTKAGRFDSFIVIRVVEITVCCWETSVFLMTVDKLYSRMNAQIWLQKKVISYTGAIFV